MYKDFLLPTGFLTGTIIGAGVFALPFIFSSAGLASGLSYLFLGAAIYSLIHLFYADIILRTAGEHRFVGYAKIYLGRPAFYLSIAMAVLEMILVLTIYLVLSVSFINLVLPNGLTVAKLLIFWLSGSFAIFLSLKKMALLELLISWGMVAVICMIFFLGVKNFSEFSWLASNPLSPNILTPLAPILFALGGRVAIPSIVKYFKNPKSNKGISLIKRSIIAGTLLPACFYALFVFGILGLSKTVSADSVSGLAANVPGFVLLAVGVFGVLALWSSYIVVGLDVEAVLKHDLKLHKFTRILLVVFAPIIIYFLSFQDFIGLVSFVGGIFLALEGIFIVAIWIRLNKTSGKQSLLIGGKQNTPALISFLVFLIALIYEISKIFT